MRLSLASRTLSVFSHVRSGILVISFCRILSSLIDESPEILVPNVVMSLLFTLRYSRFDNTHIPSRLVS
jgi:hypothetical protein